MQCNARQCNAIQHRLFPTQNKIKLQQQIVPNIGMVGKVVGRRITNLIVIHPQHWLISIVNVKSLLMLHIQCHCSRYTFNVIAHVTHSMSLLTLHIQCNCSRYTFNVIAHVTHSMSLLTLHNQGQKSATQPYLYICTEDHVCLQA